MITRKQWFALAVCAAGVVSLAACDSGGAAAKPIDPPRLTAIQLSPSGVPVLAVPVGTLQLTATGTYSDGSAAAITDKVDWTSTDESVATVSTIGLATMSTPGSTDITATDAATGVSATVSVSVLPWGLVQLDISPLDPTILIGSSLQMTAWGTLEDDSSVDYTNDVLWSSAAETIVTVSTTGLVSGAGLGASQVAAIDPVTAVTASTSVAVTDVLGLAYVALSRGSVIGGSSTPVTGVVALTSYTPDDFTVTLWSSDPTVVSVPASVVVWRGTDRVQFDVTTMPVTHKTRVYVWASDGVTQKRASLNVRKPH